MKKRHLIILSVVLCTGLGLSSASAASVENDTGVANHASIANDIGNICENIPSFTVNTKIVVENMTVIGKYRVGFNAKVITTDWFNNHDCVPVGQLVLYNGNNEVVAFADLSKNPNPYFEASLLDEYYLEYYGATCIKDNCLIITYKDVRSPRNNAYQYIVPTVF